MFSGGPSVALHFRMIFSFYWLFNIERGQRGSLLAFLLLQVAMQFALSDSLKGYEGHHVAWKLGTLKVSSNSNGIFNPKLSEYDSMINNKSFHLIP
jgi:hypothetical protein